MQFGRATCGICSAMSAMSCLRSTITNMEHLFVYGMLGLTSVVGLAFIVERGIALRWRRVVPTEIEAAVESCERSEDVPMLRRVCQQHGSPLSRLLLLAADHLDWPKAEN